MTEPTRPSQLEPGPDDEPLEIRADDPRVVALVGEYVIEYAHSLSTTVHLRLTAPDIAQMLMDVGCENLAFARDDVNDALILKGQHVAPRDVCASCAGYGHPAWSRDLAEGDPVTIFDGDGRIIWNDQP